MKALKMTKKLVNVASQLYGVVCCDVFCGKMFATQPFFLKEDVIKSQIQTLLAGPLPAPTVAKRARSALARSHCAPARGARASHAIGATLRVF